MTIFITGIFDPPVTSFEVAGLPATPRFSISPLGFVTLIHLTEGEDPEIKVRVQRWTWNEDEEIMIGGKKKQSNREADDLNILDWAIK